MIAHYSRARERAAGMTSWRLRRIDVRCRRRRDRLTLADTVRWASARDELRTRGVIPVPMSERPHWWQL